MEAEDILTESNRINFMIASDSNRQSNKLSPMFTSLKFPCFGMLRSKIGSKIESIHDIELINTLTGLKLPRYVMVSCKLLGLFLFLLLN